MITNSGLPDWLTDSWRRTLRRRCLHWYSDNARDLPWRHSSDPYEIWISEIMLQQTQVATVIPYYKKFLAAFPTCLELASADEQHVLGLWEGLGYYRRARQLHQAAMIVRDNHGGKFPTTFNEVHNLPGIGRYTAGAILSISLNQPHPIVEANTIRLYCRLLGYDADVTAKDAQHLFWTFADWILPNRNCSDFNQSLMEIGSLICEPRNPNCNSCPLNRICKTKQSKRFDEIPRPKQKTQYEDLFEVAVIIRDPKTSHVLIRQCQPDERWAGLWDFPRFTLGDLQASDIQSDSDVKAGTKHDVRKAVRDRCSIDIEEPTWIHSLKHSITRYRVHLTCFQSEIKVDKSKRITTVDSLRWVSAKELADMPLSVSGRKLAKFIEDK